MASERKTIEVAPGSEVDRLLDEARRTPLRLVRGEEAFEVNLEEGARDIWIRDDPDLARESTLAVSGRIGDAGREPTAATRRSPMMPTEDRARSKSPARSRESARPPAL